VAEGYKPTAINNVRSKSITAVVYINSRCASTVPSALAELLVETWCSQDLQDAQTHSQTDRHTQKQNTPDTEAFRQ